MAAIKIVFLFAIVALFCSAMAAEDKKDQKTAQGLGLGYYGLGYGGLGYGGLGYGGYGLGYGHHGLYGGYGYPYGGFGYFG